MNDINSAARKFLNLKNIAVVGVSSKGDVAAKVIYKKLKEQGYSIFAVNPSAKTVEGDTCYPSLESIPEKVEGVVIGTAPEITPSIVNDCVTLGIKNVWIHRSLGNGSYHPKAVEIAAKNGISVIPGGCPMMYSDTIDPVHMCMRWFLKVSGKEAQPVGFSS